MKRIDKIINMTTNRNEYTINMNKSATPVSKFRKCSQTQKVNSNNMKLPRSGNGQIEESTMAKLWAIQLDYNQFQAIRPLNVEQASSIMSSHNEISSILQLKEAILNPIKDQLTSTNVVCENKMSTAEPSVASLESTESEPNLISSEYNIEDWRKK